LSSFARVIELILIGVPYADNPVSYAQIFACDAVGEEIDRNMGREIITGVMFVGIFWH